MVISQEAMHGELNKKYVRKMRERGAAMVERMTHIKVEATRANGMIRARANANGVLEDLQIDDLAYETFPKELLEDLIVEAIRDCLATADLESVEEKRRLFPGMPEEFF
jgi:DNA-binding protein YbaB